MIMNNDATVTINGLKCQETYVITAAGTNNSMLVGPRFRQKVNVTAGLCPTTSVVTTSTSTGKACIHNSINIPLHNIHMYICAYM